MKFKPGDRVIINSEQHLGRPWRGPHIHHGTVAHGHHHQDCEPSYALKSGMCVWQSQIRHAS